MSFYTSLSGLKAAQTDMSTISHNLANVVTNGFKKSRAEFADVMASNLSQSPNMAIGSGTVTRAIQQQFNQGNMTQTGSSLDLAVAGDGFFAVKPDLSGQRVNFTRNGGFMVDAQRFVVDAQGGHLQVLPVDGSGTVVATGLDQAVSLRLPETSGTPVPTSAVTLGVTLNSGSAIPSGAFDRFDPATYNQTTQTTVYDAGGNPMTMSSYFVKTSPTTWDVHNFVGDAGLGTTAGTPSPVELTFDASGALVSPTGATTFAPFSPASAPGDQTISLQFASATNQGVRPFSVTERTQDGIAVGQLEGVTVGADGFVKASFSNGESMIIGKVLLANFANPTGLRQIGNSYWTASGLSGEPIVGEPNGDGFGSLMSGMIEGSNVDITEELVGLIAAQRAFQANAKALDTASQISQTIFNIN
jgi:flagellar hook protein FlgE